MELLVLAAVCVTVLVATMATIWVLPALVIALLAAADDPA